MKHILIVDDNKINLTTAKRELSDQYKITAVLKGSQAISFLEQNACDLVLLDINMPDMDGFAVLEEIRKLEFGREVPVIFLTADDDSRTEERCFQVGAVDYIRKPFVPEILRVRVERTLELESLRKRLAEELEDMTGRSRRDPLTGLWNRAYMQERIENVIEEGAKGALFIMDIDNFKVINDQYGHMAGDNLLKVFAELLQQCAGEKDMICRIGGDEFLIFVGEPYSRVELGRYAFEIITSMCEKMEQMEYDISPSVSIGLARVPEDGDDFKTLYSNADKALYYVKQNGKNDFHFYGDEKLAEDERTSQIVDLRYLHELMGRGNSGKGAYLMNFDSFHHIYHFIQRMVERSGREVQTILFTLSIKDGEMDSERLEYVMEQMEKTICDSLRRTDVLVRYSGKQAMTVLIDASVENGKKVVERILEMFRTVCPESDIQVDYGISSILAQKKGTEETQKG